MATSPVNKLHEKPTNIGFSKSRILFIMSSDVNSSNHPSIIIALISFSLQAAAIYPSPRFSSAVLRKRLISGCIPEDVFRISR